MTLIEMNFDFQYKIVEGYTENQAYIKIIKVLKDNADLDSENTVQKCFCRKNENSLIYHVEDVIGLQDYQYRHICLSELIIKTVFNVTHDLRHLSFLLMFEIISLL